MTDRELLELAAKAAGLKNWFFYEMHPEDGAPRHSFGLRLHLGESRWNPLTDGGDALRLAVKLGIDVMHTNIHSPQVHAMADYDVACIEDSATDPYAATRRAIVRAAAEIGKGIIQPRSENDLPEDNYYKTMAEAEEIGRNQS